MKFSIFNFQFSKKGVSLYLALIIMTILLAIGLGISTIIISQLKMIRGMGDSVVAFYAADTGIERILYEHKLCGQPGCLAPPCRPDCLGLEINSSWNENLSPDLSYSANVPEFFVYNAVGTFKKTSRAIETFLPIYKRVFVTSRSFTGDLITGANNLLAELSPKCDEFTFTNGLTAADAICNCLAKNANLPGNYKAWLTDSDPNNAPADPIGQRGFTHSTIPYRRVDEVLIANDWDDLIDGSLAQPINRNESGGLESFAQVFTNTDPDGTIPSTPLHCSNWTATSGTGNVGYSGKNDENWTSYSSNQCSYEAFSLYCFQQ